MSCGRLQVTLHTAISQAAELKLSDHPHTGQDPIPPFHTGEALAEAAARNKRRRTMVSAPVQRQSKTTLKPQYLQDYKDPLEVSKKAAVKVIKEPKTRAKPAASTEPEAKKSTEITAEPEEKNWQVVQFSFAASIKRYLKSS